MNLKQAHYIKTIAEVGSITGAARQLFISQPSLSQMLRQVENEIGLPLFERSGSVFRLTYAGERYLRAAENMLAENDRLLADLESIRKENGGRLRLGLSVQRAFQVLPSVLATFSELYPNVSVSLTEAGSAKLEALLLEGKIDLAFAALDSTSPMLHFQLLEKESIGILAGANSGLPETIPSGTPLDLEATRNKIFVSLKQGHSVRLVQDRLFHDYGFSPKILMETDSLELAKRITLANGACMLCSNIFIDDIVHLKGGAFYPLKDYNNERHFYACYRKNEKLPKYAEDFIRISSDYLTNEMTIE